MAATTSHARSPASVHFQVLDGRLGSGGGPLASGHLYTIPCGEIGPGRGQASSPHYVVSSGCGALQLAITPVPEADEAPAFELAPIAPNPFTRATRIRYRLPAVAPVLIEIFDSTGRRVRSIHLTDQTTGSHVFEWDGRDASGRATPIGLYLFKLASGTHRSTGRMIKLQ